MNDYTCFYHKICMSLWGYDFTGSPVIFSMLCYFAGNPFKRTRFNSSAL